MRRGTIFIGGILFMVMVTGVLRIGFGMTGTEFWRYYWIMGGVLIVGAVLVNVNWYWKFNKRIMELTNVLLVEQDADRFIAECKELLQGKKSKPVTAVLNLDIAAGYCYKKDFEVALDYLQKVPMKGLTGGNKTIYWLNFIYVLFRLGETEKASALLTEHRASFEKFREDSNAGGTIAIVEIYGLLAAGDKAEANVAMEAAQQRWTDQRLQEDFEQLKTLI